jgi:hypothetical protein
MINGVGWKQKRAISVARIKPLESYRIPLCLSNGKFGTHSKRQRTLPEDILFSARSLYAFLNPSRFWAFLRNSLWSWGTGSYFNSTILYRLHPFPGYLKFRFWRVRRFLDKRMKNYDTLTDDKTVKDPSDVFATSGPQFKKTAAHSTSMWHSQIRLELHQQLRNPCIVSPYAVRPAFDLSFDPRMEVCYGIIYGCYAMLSTLY